MQLLWGGVHPGAEAQGSPFVPWSDNEGDRAADSGTGFASVLELVSLQLGCTHQGVHWVRVTGVVGLSNASLLVIGAVDKTIDKLQKLLRVLGLCTLSSPWKSKEMNPWFVMRMLPAYLVPCMLVNRCLRGRACLRLEACEDTVPPACHQPCDMGSPHRSGTEFLGISGNKCDGICCLVEGDSCATALDYWQDASPGG